MLLCNPAITCWDSSCVTFYGLWHHEGDVKFCQITSFNGEAVQCAGYTTRVKAVSVSAFLQTAVRSAPLVGKIYIHTHTPSVCNMDSEKIGKVQTVALLDVIPIKRDVKTWHSYRLSVPTPDRLRDRFSLILFLCCGRASISIKALDLPV